MIFASYCNTANYKSLFFYRPTIIPNMIPNMKGNIFYTPSGSLKWGTYGECVGNLEKGSPPLNPIIHRHSERFVGNGEYNSIMYMF